MTSPVERRQVTLLVDSLVTTDTDCELYSGQSAMTVPASDILANVAYYAPYQPSEGALARTDAGVVIYHGNGWWTVVADGSTPTAAGDPSQLPGFQVWLNGGWATPAGTSS